MYCNSCGKPNPDDSIFCSSCGKVLKSTLENQAVAKSDSEQKEKMTLEEYKKYFCQSWRVLITKPLALVSLICYSVSVILYALEANDLFSTMDSVIDMLNVLPFLESSTIKDSQTILFLVQLCAIAPGVLSAVGLWMLYADAWEQSNLPINIKGFEWIRRGYATAMAVGCLGVLICLPMYFSVMGEMSGDNNSVAFGLKSSLTSAILLVIIQMISTVLISRTLIKLLDTIRCTVERCTPYDDYIKVVMIIEFVYGSLVLVEMVTSEITFGGVAMCVTPFLFGVWLLQYRNFLTEMNAEYVQDDSKWNPKAEVTWETHKGNQIACDDRQNADKTYIPAWKRVEMAKENRNGWNCMNCGTLNDLEAQCCTQCGGTERQ